MDIEKLVSFLEYLSPVIVRPSLCSNNITPKSSCQKCMEICPTQGITLDKNSIKINDCISCGLCVTVCPNHVFKLNEDQLLEVKEDNNDTLIISCSPLYTKLENKYKNYVTKINCLGQLYPELVLKLLATFRKVVIFQDANHCKQCLQAEIKILSDLEEYKNVFIDFDNKLFFVNKVADLIPFIKTSNIQPASGRRSFFKSIFTGSKTLSKQILNSALENLDAKDNEKIEKLKPLKKQYLLEALKNHNNVNLSVTLPTKKLKLTNCNFCGVCSRLCPANAIQIKNESEYKQLIFIPGLCTGCNICRDVCFYQGLDWSVNLTVKDLISTQPQILGEAEKRTCEKCQQDYFELTNDENNLCFLCKR
ncbi:MAG: energy-converting hydrogenase subunit [Clostridia bacterium]|jgi:ferredoxin|nr:energy-converting hydrogenase subunit [Clostridia bacterium]MDN5323484.1 energy-converting hydrogenase subunit [Clostridia bacterium]